MPQHNIYTPPAPVPQELGLKAPTLSAWSGAGVVHMTIADADIGWRINFDVTPDKAKAMATLLRECSERGIPTPHSA
jgi:hypothetical protein